MSATLRDDLLAMTVDDMMPIETGMLLALVEMANEEGQSEEMLAYLGDFLTERAYLESINVQGKSLVVLQMLCDKSPAFLASAKANADLITRAVELSQAKGFEGVNEAQVRMLNDTATQLLLLLGEKIEVQEDTGAGGGGFIIKRVARRAVGGVAGGVGGVAGGVAKGVGGVAAGVGGAAGRARGTVIGGVTMVGQGVSSTVLDAAGGVVEKTPLNKLTRTKTVPADGITKEQRNGAIRLFDIVMKHGRKQIESARRLAEGGHQIMANILMTMEMLSIQKEAAGERFEYLDDERFDQVSALFSEVSAIEQALRHHNAMKMAIYSVLNKQRHGSSTLEFNMYVFALENERVTYYVMGEAEGESGFDINYVYDFSTTSLIKKSALERIATLGMGSSTLDGDESEEKKFSFKISLLKSKTGVEKSKDDLMLEDLDMRKRAAIAAEDWRLAEQLTLEMKELQSKLEAQSQPEAEQPEPDAEGQADPGPGSDSEPEPEPEPEATKESDAAAGSEAEPSKPMSRMEKAKAAKAKAKAAAAEAKKKASEKGQKAAAQAQERAIASAAIAQTKASAAKAKGSAVAKGARDAAQDFDNVDIQTELAGKVMNGVGALADLKVDTVVAAAPDQATMDMWKAAMSPLCHQVMRYRTKTTPLVEEKADQEQIADEDSGAPRPELDTPAEPVLSEWSECFVVLYKTVLMVFNREGGMRLDAFGLWRIFPSSVMVCTDPDIGGEKVFSLKNITTEVFFDTLDGEDNHQWVNKLTELLCKRGNAKECAEFIEAEEARLAERAAAAASQRSRKDDLLGLLEDDGEADWAGAGVRKGVKGVAAGVLAGVTDMVEEGSSGMRKDGTRGLVLGMGKGAASLAQNTALNMAGLVKNTAEGVVATPTMALSITAGVSEAVDSIKEDGLKAPRLKRTTVEEAGEMRKDEIASAKRTFELAMRHGMQTLRQAMKNTENGHEVMANVILTLELLHIQQASAEEKMAYLDDESFDALSDLFNEISTMEKTLRTHNVMKMAVYGILNKQKSNVTSLAFQKYVFSLEDGQIRYYVLGEVDEPEDSFSVHHVYEVGQSDKLKRSKLESIATLGMGASSLEESDNDEKRFAFKISVLAPKPDTDTETEATVDQDAQDEPIPEGVPPEDTDSIPEPGGPPPSEDSGGSRKVASKGLSFAKAAGNKAKAKAVAAAEAKRQRAATAELNENDLRAIMRGKLVQGADNLAFMTSKSMVVAAPDQFSMDMWKSALQPELDATMKYRKRTVPAVRDSEQLAEAEQTSEAQPQPEPARAAVAEPVVSEWVECYVVLYKTNVMLMDKAGGNLLEAVTLWRVPPTSVCACKDAEIGGTADAVLTFKRVAVDAETEYFFDSADKDVADTWIKAIADLQSQRGDPVQVEKFIVAESKRLAEISERKAQASSIIGSAGDLLGSVADVVDQTGQTEWLGDGVRKGVVGLASGVLSGVNDTRHMAYSGLKKDGTQGMVIGLGKGLTTKLGKNVVVGVAGVVSNVAEGVAATADKVIDVGAEGAGAVTQAPVDWWHGSAATNAAVGVSRMAVVKLDFNPEHPEWSDDSVELESGRAVKLLDDSDATRWRVAADGVEGYVPPSCLLTTGGSGRGGWAAAVADTPALEPAAAPSDAAIAEKTDGNGGDDGGGDDGGGDDGGGDDDDDDDDEDGEDKL